MRFKVTTYVQVARTLAGETEREATHRIWQALNNSTTKELIGDQVCEDFVMTIPERLTPDEDNRFPFGLGAKSDFAEGWQHEHCDSGIGHLAEPEGHDVISHDFVAFPAGESRAARDRMVERLKHGHDCECEDCEAEWLKREYERLGINPFTND